MKKLTLILAIFISGCQVTPEKIQRASAGIRSEIVWCRSDGQNPKADGRKIYIDLVYIEKYNIPLRPILLHEDYHNRGMGHCKNTKCLMYQSYQTDLIFRVKKELCKKCKLKPTTLGWLEKQRSKG